MVRYSSGQRGQSVKLLGYALRRFESFPYHHLFYSPIAQMVEHLHYKQRVTSSSLVRRIFVRIRCCWWHLRFGSARAEFESQYPDFIFNGRVCERPKQQILKICSLLKRLLGSNPSSSATFIFIYGFNY